MTANLMEYLGFVCGLAATVTSWVTWGAASQPSATTGSPAINPAGPVAFRKERRLTSFIIAISPLQECSSLAVPEVLCVCGSGLPRLPQGTQRISQHDSLPAQKLQRQIVALRQGAAFIIRRQQVVGARTSHQIGLVNVAGCPGGALVDQIGRHSLRRARPKVQSILPRGVEPVVGRLLHGAPAGGNELGRNRAGQPLESQPAPLAILVVRSPRRVADHILLAVQHILRLVQNHAAGGEKNRGVAQPVLSLVIRVRTQVDDELAAIRRLERPVDHSLHVVEAVCGQPGDQVNRKLRVAERHVALSEERIGHRALALVLHALEFGVEQRQFRIDRSLLGLVDLSLRAHDLERNSQGGGNVEHALHQAGLVQAGGHGSFDLRHVSLPLDLFLGAGIEHADIARGNGAFQPVILADLNRHRVFPVHHQQDILPGLSAQAGNQTQQQEKSQHCFHLTRGQYRCSETGDGRGTLHRLCLPDRGNPFVYTQLDRETKIGIPGQNIPARSHLKMRHSMGAVPSLLAIGALPALAQTLPASCGGVGAKSYTSPAVTVPAVVLNRGTVITVTNASIAVYGDTSSVHALVANPGPDGISLQEAIMATNNDPGTWVIQFAPALKGSTISVDSAPGGILAGLSGGNVTINGDIDGDGQPDITLTTSQSGVGIAIGSGGNTLYGLALRNFAYGVWISAPPPGQPGATGGTLSNITISNLVLTDIQYLGIGVNPPGSPANQSTLDHILITGNTISGNAAGPVTGIDLEVANTGNTLQHITVANNNMTIPMSGGGGIAMNVGAGMGSTNNQALDILIANNTISAVPFFGIRIAEGLDSASGNLIDGVQIIANQIHITGQGTGINVAGGDGASDDANPSLRPIQYSENNVARNIAID